MQFIWAPLIFKLSTFLFLYLLNKIYNMHNTLSFLHFLKLSTIFLLQLALYKNIKPSFSNRPIVIVINKIDVVKPDELPEDKSVS